MHGGRSKVYSAFVVFWPQKHNGIYFSVERHFKANKEKVTFHFSLFEMHGGRSMVYSALSSFGLTSIMVYVFLSNAVS